MKFSSAEPGAASGFYDPRRPALQPGAAAAVLPVNRVRVALPYQARRLVGEWRYFAMLNV